MRRPQLEQKRAPLAITAPQEGQRFWLRSNIFCRSRDSSFSRSSATFAHSGARVVPSVPFESTYTRPISRYRSSISPATLRLSLDRREISTLSLVLFVTDCAALVNFSLKSLKNAIVIPPFGRRLLHCMYLNHPHGIPPP